MCHKVVACFSVVQVYERAIPAVPKEQRLSILELYVSRATDFFGIAKVRQK
jgi:pre-mRNA-splicing factor SYF1